MKIFQLFTKTPSYKRFNYTPRYYNPEEEERKARIKNIENEFNASVEKEKEIASDPETVDTGYRTRIHGSFSRARQANVKTGKGETSPMLLRLALLLIITIGLIGYMEYGQIAVYGVILTIVPLFLFLKFRGGSQRG